MVRREWKTRGRPNRFAMRIRRETGSVASKQDASFTERSSRWSDTFSHGKDFTAVLGRFLWETIPRWFCRALLQEHMRLKF